MGQCCFLFMAMWKEFYNEKETKIRRVYIIRNVDCLIDYFRIDFTLNELVNEGYITKEQLDKYTAEKQ